ncbi:MAG: hypothetical protein OQK24_01015 [Magnetovibrio sp.]|nr:hypothetical protein [Magnetovibrio sp.]
MAKTDSEETTKFTKPVDPNWVRTPQGGFLPFLSLDPEELGLSGVGGVYLIWHGGVKPEWVYAGHTTDLAAAFHQTGNMPDVNFYEKNGGLFVAWAPVKVPYRAGVVKYIEETFNTLVQNNDAYNDKTIPVPVIAPVAKRKGR